MGITWSTMKVGEGNSKEVTTVVIGEDQVYSNKAPSTSTSTIAIGEDQVCSMHEVCDGKTTSMPVTVADLLPFKEENSVFEPAPSDEEAWEATSTIKELFEPLAHSRISEIGCSSIITPSDSVTSEAKQLELITPLQSDTVQLDSKLRDAIGVCCSLETCCCAVREMVVGAVKDKKVWDAFMNCDTMSAIACSSNDSVLEPAPSDEEVQEAISLIKEVLEPQISETGCSFMITSSDSVTSEAKQLELINAQPQSNILQLNPDLRAAIALCCNLEKCPPSVKKMFVGVVKDEKLWHGFMNSESVVEFMTGVANDIPQLTQLHVVNGSAVGNIDGDQGSDKNRYLKLIIDKAKEMVLDVVSKAFDGMEKVFLGHEQQSHQKSKQSCFDSKYQEGSSTSEKIFDTVEHVMRTPFLAALLVNVIVMLCRLFRVMLKHRSLI